MKTRKRFNKFTAMFLTLALLFTMLPTIALAEDAELIAYAGPKRHLDRWWSYTLTA